jgi:hypothetical protein
MPFSQSDPLRPRLDKLEDELEGTITEVCDGKPVRETNTGELIRLEETLAIAAETAKEAVSLRRRMRADGLHEADGRNT